MRRDLLNQDCRLTRCGDRPRRMFAFACSIAPAIGILSIRLNLTVPSANTRRDRRPVPTPTFVREALRALLRGDLRNKIAW